MGEGKISGLVLVQNRLREDPDETTVYLSEAPAAEYEEAFFPCVRCNGEGWEVKWLQDCEKCSTTGHIQTAYGEETCPKCLGRGGY